METTRRLLVLLLLDRVKAVVPAEVEEVEQELLDHKTLDRIKLMPRRLPPKPTHSSKRPHRVVTSQKNHSRLKVRKKVESQTTTTVEVARVLDVVEPVEPVLLLLVAMPSQLRSELLVNSEA